MSFEADVFPRDELFIARKSRHLHHWLQTILGSKSKLMAVAHLKDFVVFFLLSEGNVEFEYSSSLQPFAMQ